MPAHAKYPLREMEVGEVRAVKDKPNLANYIYKRGLDVERRFRTWREGDERKIVRVA